MPLLLSICGKVSLWFILFVFVNIANLQVHTAETNISGIFIESVNTAHNGTPESPGSSSITITAPPVNAGDVLIAQITAAPDFSPSNAICPPAGWISLYKNDFEQKIIQQIFYYVAMNNQPETSVTWVFKRNNGACNSDGNFVSGKGATGGILRYSGVDPVNPIDKVAGLTASGSGNVATAPSVSTSADNSTIIHFFSAFKDLTFTTANNRIYTTGSSNNSTERTSGAYQSTQSLAGQSPSFNSELSTSAEWVSATIALRPEKSQVEVRKLLFHVQPTTTIARETIVPPIEVWAVDGENNIDESYNGRIFINIDSNPGNGFLSGTTQTVAQSGIARFEDLSINSAGTNYTLIVEGDHVIPTVSNAFDILPIPSEVVIISGNNQQGQIETPLENPFVVEVRDNNRNPISGIQVHFAITQTPSDASGYSLSNSSATTDNRGRASTTLTPGNRGGTYRVRASVSGTNDVIFNASVPMHTISGIITEADMPLANVSVQSTGGHQQIVPTEANGHYTLTDIPAGSREITITPSKSGYAFSPEYRVIEEPVVENITEINFITLPPPAPELVFPPPDIIEMNTSLVLSWKPAERTSSYGLQVSTDTSFDDFIINQTAIRDTQYTVSELEYGTTFYWRVNAVNPSGTSEWSTVRSFTTQAILFQRIALRPGWNTISSYLMPLDETITEIFSDINNNNNIIVKNGSGDVYIPEFHVNEIKSWNYREGYQIFIQPGPDTLVITGPEIKPDLTPIQLNSGWNMISFLRMNPMDPSAALENILSHLVILKNDAGQIYIPAGIIDDEPLSTMGNMEPGFGYHIYLTGETELVYPGNDIPSSNISDGIISSTLDHVQVSLPVYSAVNTSGNNAILIIISSDFIDGDEVGVWTQSKRLVGSGAVKKGRAVIPVWGTGLHSENTGIGAEKGEPLNLTLWSSGSQIPTDLSLLSLTDILNQLEIDIESDFRYQPDAIWIAAAEIDDQKPGMFALYQNYPNPFNPASTIQFAIARESNVLLEVFNILGQKVATLVDEEHTAGVYEVVLSADLLSSGTYFYRLQAGDFIDTKKFIVLK